MHFFTIECNFKVCFLNIFLFFTPWEINKDFKKIYMSSKKPQSSFAEEASVKFIVRLSERSKLMSNLWLRVNRA